MAITGRFSEVSEVLVAHLRVRAVRGLVRVGMQQSHLRTVKLARDSHEFLALQPEARKQGKGSWDRGYIREAALEAVDEEGPVQAT